MAAHDPLRCKICRCADQALEASATELENHFIRQGFCPSVGIDTPGVWVWRWLRADHQAWSSSLAQRGHVEKRVRQIEHLSGVDEFVADDEARVWLDLGLRTWKEGLPRSVEQKIRCDWELGDEMPTCKEMHIVGKRLQEDGTPQVRTGVVAALQDRFNHAAPVDRSRLVQLLCISWGWLPEPGKDSGFLDKNDYIMGHISSIWQCNAIRMLHDRIASFTHDERQPLLGWIAAALLPGQFYSPGLTDPQIYRLLADADHWPDDPRLPWLARAWGVHSGEVAARLSQVVLRADMSSVEGDRQEGVGARRL